MCMFSMYDRSNTRKAKVGETLTRADYRQHAAFVTDEGPVAPMLACIKHGTTLVIDEVRFHGTAAPWLVEKYGGQSLTVTFIDGSRSSWRRGRGYAADCIMLSDGMVIRFCLLAKGVTATIPRKVRKDKGVRKPRSLDKVFGLDHVAAILPPDPKPEDEDVPSEPTEPAKEPAPVEEPAVA